MPVELIRLEYLKWLFSLRFERLLDIKTHLFHVSKGEVKYFSFLCAQTCSQMSAQDIIQDALYIGFFQGNRIQNKKAVKLSKLAKSGPHQKHT